MEILEARGVEGFWIHCDVDVLDERAMPAVDTPEPDGLGFADLGRLLAAELTDCLCEAVEGSRRLQPAR